MRVTLDGGPLLSGMLSACPASDFLVRFTHPSLPNWSIHVPSQHITMRFGIPRLVLELASAASAMLSSISSMI